MIEDTIRSLEVKFPVELVHLILSDLVALVGVERRHEDVDLTLTHIPIPPAALDYLPQVLPCNVPPRRRVELLEQLLHALMQNRLGDFSPSCIGPELGGTVVVVRNWDAGAAVCAFDGGLVKPRRCTAHW
jgi:hypothetical protein